MDMLSNESSIVSTAVRASAPVYHFTKLELAPEGWQYLVEKHAEGNAELIGTHSYCQECGAIIEGAGRMSTGHHMDCSTMVARRMLANYPLLLARHEAEQREQAELAAQEAQGVDMDRIHAVRPAVAVKNARTGTDG
jgi:hypothetical protein